MRNETADEMHTPLKYRNPHFTVYSTIRLCSFSFSLSSVNSYAVIATGCASCPRIKCERPGCDLNFCYHCKAEWHPDQTCDAARASRQSPMRAASGSISQDSQHRSDDIKPCPRCQVLIVKMDDGSCNHMVCAVCGAEFCWLCMKEISDLHYLR